jgi:hypothetical protein
MYDALLDEGVGVGSVVATWAQRQIAFQDRAMFHALHSMGIFIRGYGSVVALQSTQNMRRSCYMKVKAIAGA